MMLSSTSGDGDGMSAPVPGALSAPLSSGTSVPTHGAPSAPPSSGTSVPTHGALPTSAGGTSAPVHGALLTSAGGTSAPVHGALLTPAVPDGFSTGGVPQSQFSNPPARAPTPTAPATRRFFFNSSFHRRSSKASRDSLICLEEYLARTFSFSSGVRPWVIFSICARCMLLSCSYGPFTSSQ